MVKSYSKFIYVLLHISGHTIITIVIPTYNRISFLYLAIQSIRAQTFADWELIVADDGSTDDTVKIIGEIKDSRIRVLELPHTGNIAFLRNVGAETGSGKWIAFLDSDDEWISNKLEIQLQILENQKKQWSYSGYEFIDSNSKTMTNKIINFQPISGWIAPQILTCEASVPIGSLLVERALFNETGGFNIDAKIILREDYELVLRLALRAEALPAPNILLRIREHEGRTTNAFNDGPERSALVYKRFLNSIKSHKLKRIARRSFAHEVAEISEKKFEQGKYIAAAVQFLNAFINNDKCRHLLSVVRRAAYFRYKIIKQKNKENFQ